MLNRKNHWRYQAFGYTSKKISISFKSAKQIGTNIKQAVTGSAVSAVTVPQGLEDGNHNTVAEYGSNVWKSVSISASLTVSYKFLLNMHWSCAVSSLKIMSGVSVCNLCIDSGLLGRRNMMNSDIKCLPISLIFRCQLIYCYLHLIPFFPPPQCNKFDNCKILQKI